MTYDFTWDCSSLIAIYIGTFALHNPDESRKHFSRWLDAHSYHVKLQGWVGSVAIALYPVDNVFVFIRSIRWFISKALVFQIVWSRAWLAEGYGHLWLNRYFACLSAGWFSQRENDCKWPTLQIPMCSVHLWNCDKLYLSASHDVSWFGFCVLCRSNPFIWDGSGGNWILEMSTEALLGGLRYRQGVILGKDFSSMNQWRVGHWDFS